MYLVAYFLLFGYSAQYSYFHKLILFLSLCPLKLSCLDSSLFIYLIKMMSLTIFSVSNCLLLIAILFLRMYTQLFPRVLVPQLTWAWQVFVDLIHVIMLSLSFLKIWSILSLGLSSSRGRAFSPEGLTCIHQLWFSPPLPAVLLVDQKCIFYLNNFFVVVILGGGGFLCFRFLHCYSFVDPAIWKLARLFFSLCSLCRISQIDQFKYNEKIQ